MKKIFTLIAAALVAGSAFAQEEGFVNIIKNGDLSGNDMTNFKVNDYWEDGYRHPELGGDPVDARIMVDGKERYIIVGSNTNPTNPWDAQFFVTVPEDMAFEVDTKLQLKMRVKADRAQSCDGQVHAAPGVYVQDLQFAVPSINFTDAWTDYDSGIMTVTGDGARTLTFNLSTDADANTFYIDDIELWVKRPKPINWINLVWNSDCEGDDARSLVGKDGATGARETFFAEGEGVDGSNAVVVTSIDNAANDHDTQFFITVSHVFALGEKFKVEFDYRAEDPANAGTQSHALPEEYLYWSCIGNVDFQTGWQHFKKVVTVSSGWGGSMENMQTIAFNLNNNHSLATKFYFDNITLCIDEEIATPEELAEAADIEDAKEAVATAINSTKVQTAAKTIYNVAGQQIKTLQKGLNIVEGKKVYVK